ncbi:MAG: hypothetical protein M3R65_01730 [Gemmatimonadota bacterium]|nr:hypothetical protein [Gemmatimonadota bacterium]
MLSPHTTDRFREALREHCVDPGDCHEKMSGLLKGAAGEARDAGVTAEQLVIWVKQVWEELVADGVLSRSVDSARARDVIVSSVIRAYYVQ